MEELTPELPPAVAPPASRGKRIRLWIGKRLVTVAILYAGLGAYALFFADRAIFHPQEPGYVDTPATIKLTTKDGARISATYLRNPAARYTILYSHGNAEDIGDVRPLLEQHERWGFSVFSYDYRGYGTSEGKPSERTTYEDVDAAFLHLTEKLQVPEDRIIVYGTSLGGGPSVDLASRKNVAGLVVQSAFVSAFRVVTHFRIFPWDEFDNLSKIGRVRCPVLVMHGRADTLIKFWHGERLFEAANEPKINLWVDGAGHNDFRQVAAPQVREKLLELVKIVDARHP